MRLESLRTLLAIAAPHDLEVIQSDIISAYPLVRSGRRLYGVARWLHHTWEGDLGLATQKGTLRDLSDTIWWSGLSSSFG